jgi:homoserine/homoserine lactone efflux protein
VPEPITVLSLAGLLFVVSLTPGPAAAFCIAIGMEEEDNSALWAPVGVALGKVVHLSAAAAGAAWINEMPTAVRGGVFFVAIGYLLWEGVRHWTHRVTPADHDRRRSGPHDFHIVLDGFVVSILNPQSLASAVAILPLFVDGNTSVAGLALFIGVGALAVAAAYAMYELIAVALAHHLQATTLNRVVGATYVAAATSLAVLAAA